MKFLLPVLVGAICLLGKSHAQTGYITDIVSNAINVSKTNLTEVIQLVNCTINTADTNFLKAWNQNYKSIADLYISYYNRFKVYTTIDLSSLNNSISNLHNTMSTPNPIQDVSITQLFDSVQTSVQQIEIALNAAAKNMTSGSAASCTNVYVGTCAKKYGTKLTTAPISIDRIRDCVTDEQTRFTDIGSNMTSQLANILISATNYLKLVDVCDIPEPAVLNNPSPSGGTPSIQCLTNYLQRITYLPINTYVTDSMRFPQTQLVSFRMQRCARLVQLDIQDRITQVLADFYNCLKTGS